MNRGQKYVLAVTMVAVVVLFLFPPFHFIGVNGIVLNMGYGFLFEPPKYREMPATINTAFLLAEWLGCLVFAGLGFALLAGSRDRASIASSGAPEKRSAPTSVVPQPSSVAEREVSKAMAQKPSSQREVDPASTQSTPVFRAEDPSRVQQTFAEASTDEIVSRLGSGGLTVEAQAIAEDELRRRGIDLRSAIAGNVETGLQTPAPLVGGFWRQLTSGDFGLAKTYWVYSVLPNIGFTVFVTAVPILAFSIVGFIAYVLYSVPALLGTWRAARRYRGFRLWSALAALAVVVGWASLLAVLVAILGPVIAPR